MKDEDDHITFSQEWSVRFTDEGKEKFKSIGGSPQLCEWSFPVSVPAKEERTEHDLVNEIRALGIEKVYQQCQKYGLQISFGAIRELDSYDYLQGSKQ